MSRTIELAGPTGLVTTTTKGVEDELATRLLAVSVPEDPAATRAVLLAIGRAANGSAPEPPDLAPWHALQRWLEREGARSVTIPYAERLAERVSADLVRMRRDFPQLLNLICAHALLHQRQRERDTHGRIIATLEDYRAVYQLVAPLYGVIVSGGITPGCARLSRPWPSCVRIQKRRCRLRSLRACSAAINRASAGMSGARSNLATSSTWKRGEAGQPNCGRGSHCPPPVTALPEPETLLLTSERNGATLAGDCDHDAENTVAPGGATPPQHPQRPSPPDEGSVASVAPPLRPGEQRCFGDADAEIADRCGVAPQMHTMMFDAAIAEQVCIRLRRLGGVYAYRLAEVVGVPFATLQPVLEWLARQGQLVVWPSGTMTPESVIASPDEARRRGWLSEQKGG
ncbi:hypothetical protein [Thermorudis peleae]|uniref:hypothetical protein n=1 Tax=Thermorudis peleae TaxID=1382356 RepID=UPI00056FCE42|nr:hypothetical protein [Thermorudis peleae]